MQDDSSLPLAIQIIISCASGLVLVLLVGAFLWWRQNTINRKNLGKNLNRNSYPLGQGNNGPYYSSSQNPNIFAGQPGNRPVQISFTNGSNPNKINLGSFQSVNNNNNNGSFIGNSVLNGSQGNISAQALMRPSVSKDELMRKGSGNIESQTKAISLTCLTQNQQQQPQQSQPSSNINFNMNTKAEPLKSGAISNIKRSTDQISIIPMNIPNIFRENGAAASAGAQTNSSNTPNSAETATAAGTASSMLNQTTTLTSTLNTTSSPISIPGYLLLSGTIDDHYEVDWEKPIGSGGSAKIYKGTVPSNSTNASPTMETANENVTVAAIKVFELNKEKEVEVNEEAIKYEIALLGSIPNSNNVVRLLGYFEKPSLAIVMKFYPFTLRQLIFDDSLKLNFRQKLSMAKQMAAGIAHLHKYRIVHFDLKPLNVLVEVVDHRFHCVISDLGSARPIGGDIKSNIERLVRGLEIPVKVGLTLSYTSPELIKYLAKVGSFAVNCQEEHLKSDIYSFGITLYEVVFQMKAWNSYGTQREMLQAVVKGERPRFPANFKLPSSSDEHSRRGGQLSSGTGGNSTQSSVLESSSIGSTSELDQPSSKNDTSILRNLWTIIQSCWVPKPDARPDMKDVIDLFIK